MHGVVCLLARTVRAQHGPQLHQMSRYTSMVEYQYQYHALVGVAETSQSFVDDEAI